MSSSERDPLSLAFPEATRNGVEFPAVGTRFFKLGKHWLDDAQ